MREPVPLLDTRALPWTPLGAPGLFMKLLGRDTESGAITGLFRLDPGQGMQAPAAPHYHHTYEEIFVLGGCFSFDGHTWLRRLSYCYHAPETVHGFASAIREDSVFISRIGRELDFNYVNPPAKLEPYYVGDSPPERGFAVVPRPEELPWAEHADENGRVVATSFELSRHPRTGEGSMLARLQPGWHGPARSALRGNEEIFVVAGALLAGDGRRLEEGCYSFQPAGAARSAWSAPEGALVYLSTGASPELLG
jgi:quercetin dioxygenase-like cupin family protein